jgi:predicted ATP-grasp superfamily ATP-dependent carboligase
MQDLTPGDGSNQLAYCAFFKDRKALGRMASRRLGQHPREFGRASSYVETIDLPILASSYERFLRVINDFGLVEVEFKLDPRDGQFKLLDVNARTWGDHSLGFAAGVDFPFMLYDDQIGETADPSRGIPGHFWIRLLTDVPTAILEVSGRRMRLKDYSESMRRIQTDAVFDSEDPFPGIAERLLLPYLIVKRGF